MGASSRLALWLRKRLLLLPSGPGALCSTQLQWLQSQEWGPQALTVQSAICAAAARRASGLAWGLGGA